jgi:hypothetical protein
MATQLFLLSTPASTHRGTNTAKLNAATSGWDARALGLSRGSGIVASAAMATVTGATNGLEVGSTTTLPYEWISEPVAADTTISGTITANIWAAESSMTANVAIDVVIDIIRSDLAGTIVQIVKSTFATELGTARSANNFTAGMTSGYTPQTLNRGDRLRIRVFGDDGGGTMATGFTFNASFNGATAAADGDSYVTFTENITFESAPGTASIAIAQDAWTSPFTTTFGYSTNEKAAQQFTAVGSMTAVNVSIRKAASPTDNVVCELWSDASDLPDTLIATSPTTVSGASLGTAGEVYVNFDLSYATTASTKYWIVLRRSGSLDATNNYAWDRNTTNPYANGFAATWNTSAAWAPLPSDDFRFRVYGPVPATTVIYLTDTASDVATASVDREAWTSRGASVQTDVRNTAAGFTAPLQITDTAGGTVVDWFTKKLQAVTLTGLAQANIRVLESAIAANASIGVEIARVDSDGTNPTVWAYWCMSANNARTGELNTSEAAETVNISGDDLAISDQQRLRIRLYIDDMPTTAMGASQTVTLFYAGTSAAASGDTYITFPVTLTEYVSTTPDIAHFGASPSQPSVPHPTLLRRRTW